MLQECPKPIIGNLELKNIKIGTFNMTTTAQKIETGFKPTFICANRLSTAVQYFVFEEEIDPSKYKTTATASAAGYAGFGGTSSVCLVSVDDDGFQVKAGSSTYGGIYKYVAMA